MLDSSPNILLRLEVPGLTDHWYIRTEHNQTIEFRPNPSLLNVGLGISLACAVLANMCLITRFLEKRVKTMTILCTIFLTVHGTHHAISRGLLESIDMTDLINIVAVTIFGVQHRLADGFTYGQSYWLTICSTAASCVTNATLIWDLYRTADFSKSGKHNPLNVLRTNYLTIIRQWSYSQTTHASHHNHDFILLYMPRSSN
jgi:hypothetical protein